VFSKMKLSQRIAVLVTFGIAFLILVGLVSINSMIKIGHEIEEIATVDLPLARQIRLLTEAELETGIVFERARGRAGESSFAKVRAAYDALWAETIEMASALADGAQSDATGNEIAKIKKQLATLKRKRDSFVEASIRALRDSALLTAATIEDLEHQADEVDAGLVEVLENFETFTSEAVRTAEVNEKQAIRTVVVLFVVALVLTIGFAVLIIRNVNAALRKASLDAQSASTQMLSAVQEQSAATSETASSVSQTSSTVHELSQTSQSALEKSNLVTEVADRSLDSAGQAREAISEGVAAMERIREEVESIAQTILNLSEKHIQIGEIVDVVNAIAEQSNLLAVNASIEAAKAEEHGKGFAVVAGEVKELAEQSKDATGQIRRVLADIQKSSNAAVMVSEQGGKRVAEGSSVIEELGAAIQTLSDTVEENADAARQIAMTSNQQLSGIEQIGSAMQNIEQASSDNAASARQLEQTAEQVSSVSRELNAVIEGA